MDNFEKTVVVAFLVTGLLMLLATTAFCQTVPVNSGPDIASYPSSAANGIVAAILALRGPDKLCHLEQLGIMYGTGNGLTLGLKAAIPSRRPCTGCPADGFPSGHTMNAFIGWTVYDWKVGSSFGALTGILRHDANRHTWGQIAAGAAIGVGSSFSGRLLHCSS